MATINDLPSETLWTIFCNCLDDSSSLRTFDDHIFLHEGSGAPHYLIKDNYRRYVSNHGEVLTKFTGLPEGKPLPYAPPMVRRISQPIHATLRLVCRRWNEISKRRPIMIDLLIEKHRKSALMQNFAGFPYMPSSLEDQRLLNSDYWKVKAIEKELPLSEDVLADVNNIIDFWKQRPRIAFRVFCLSWNYARGVCLEEMRGKIDTLCIGFPGKRASHIWEGSYAKLCQGLAVKNIRVVNLRVRASNNMMHDLTHLPLRSLKRPANVTEMMGNHSLACYNLVWEFLPPYDGQGLDLNVFVPNFSGHLVLTSGSKTVNDPRKRMAFFKDTWIFDGLPSPGKTRKNARNVRDVETIVLQHIVIESLDAFFTFFPRLKKILLYTGAYSCTPDGTLLNIRQELSRKGLNTRYLICYSTGTYTVY